MSTYSTNLTTPYVLSTNNLATYSTNLTTPYVLSTNNLEVKNEITYLPIYMLGFLKKDDEYNYIAKLEI